MRKNIPFLIMLLLLLLLGSHVLAMSSPNFQLNWHVPITSGGGGSTSSTTYMINLTIGQSFVGNASDDNYQVSLGYWPGIQEKTYQLYLPTVIKQ